MAEIRPLDPNLRQKIAAMLSGDAKAGSVRAQLVHGLLGSQTGDDSGLVGMTPLGAAFDVDAANRDRRQGGSGLGHTINAAAGLIPGAGPQAKALERGLGHLLENGASHDGEYWNGIEAAMSHLKNADPEAHSAITSVVKRMNNKIVDPEGIAELLEQHVAQPDSPSVRDQLAAASKDDDKGATVVDAKSPPSVAGTKIALSDATKPQKVTPTSVSAKDAYTVDDVKEGSRKPVDFLHPDPGAEHLEKVSGGDPKKLNFIKNAMQDEGGNVPEDVADTVIDHAKQTGKLNLIQDAVFDALGGNLSREKGSPETNLNEMLAKTHSIPEMLAMHYDLNPEKLGAAYKMPGARNRPTQ